MRADRLLSLVLLLRDVDALSTAGIPVYAERGRAGGFALLPGFSTDLTGLTPSEAVALLTSGAASTPGALGLGAEFCSAIRKVVAALPERARRDATGAAERVLVRRGGWLTDPDQDTGDALAAVQHAVFAGRRLRIRYRAGNAGNPVDERARWRTIDPIGLVEAAGRWYLLATHDGADRTYRVSRIEAADELDEPATRPDGVDLEQLWLRRRAEFRDRHPGERVRLRLPDERRDELVRAAVDVRDTGDPDEVEAVFGDLRHAARILWPLLPDAEILDPPELRTALRDRARAVAETLA